MLADAIVVVHLSIVLFVVTMVPLVYVGAARHWAWVRGWRWRLLHLGAIVVISAESLLGVDCPLTVWEDTLRRQETASGFIERWVDGVLFYDAPTWVFTAAYVAFAGLVVITWVVVPPTKGPHKPVDPTIHPQGHT
jgi:uncharacterized protein DUF2784